MKRLCAIILSLCYFTYVADITIYQHFCMGELVSASIFPSSDQACTRCGMEKHTAANKGCCKDITINAAASEPHTSSVIDVAIDAATYILYMLPAAGFPIHKTIKAAVVHGQRPRHTPPPGKQPLYLRHQDFRI